MVQLPGIRHEKSKVITLTIYYLYLYLYKLKKLSMSKSVLSSKQAVLEKTEIDGIMLLSSKISTLEYSRMMCMSEIREGLSSVKY